MDDTHNHTPIQMAQMCIKYLEFRKEYTIDGIFEMQCFAKKKTSCSKQRNHEDNRELIVSATFEKLSLS